MFLIGYLQEKCCVVSEKGAALKPRDQSQQRRDAGLFHFLVQATDFAATGWVECSEAAAAAAATLQQHSAVFPQIRNRFLSENNSLTRNVV